VIALVMISLALLGSSGASPLDKAATELVEKLAIANVSGFNLASDVAVEVTTRGGAGGDQSRLGRALSGLVRARIETLGVRSSFAVETGGDPEQAARDLGAEWLLAIAAEPVGKDALRLWAELRAIDRGLWAPVPKPGMSTIYATAELTTKLDPSIEALLATPEPTREVPRPAGEGGLRFDGAPARLFTVDDRVLALAICEVGGRRAPVLAVLESRSLELYEIDEPRAHRRLAVVDLSSAPRASEPSREPIGALACEKGEIALGTSGMRLGQLLRAEATRSGEIAIRPVRTLEGVPLGYLPGGRIVLGAVDGGRSRYASALRVDSAGKVSERDLGAALLDVSLDPSAPAGFRAIGVAVDHRLVRLGDDLDKIQPVAPSGVGVRIVAEEKSAYFIVTSSEADENRDKIALLSLDGGAAKRLDVAEIEGSVFATAIGSIAADARALFAAAYHPGLNRTDVLALRLAPAGAAARLER
jgi:hypothetical protein